MIRGKSCFYYPLMIGAPPSPSDYHGLPTKSAKRDVIIHLQCILVFGGTSHITLIDNWSKHVIFFFFIANICFDPLYLTGRLDLSRNLICDFFLQVNPSSIGCPFGSVCYEYGWTLSHAGDTYVGPNRAHIYQRVVVLS